ncbi:MULTISPECIES: cupredoxin family copper-binding protein [unclassified Mesorhizobium]|uniref:cupredoxin domain-containing protein n=1 Tax=unclassified Mesorhizobium TaxID=325217 RepID=UPI000FD7A75C|nr:MULTISPECIES: cupredoxin family copper-binding protein [unclassified Mesorhizobium]TGQ30602.1 copper-binding protein [Mesorhizobium sp. M00.F.Ca.ET.216.01.1.1]TIS60037.1 MAG: copper-binding protein [Mesorhizobium sp.]TIS89563.1 MAG: copper-binding protein [Mesorhizobium sp.]
MRTMLALALLVFAIPAFAANHAVQIKGMKFSPAKIRVAVGDTVTFTNADPMAHTATALDGSFDTGQLAKGKSAKVKISAAGAHAFKCAIHASMKGTVTAK